jgi:hypothetical protein
MAGEFPGAVSTGKDMARNGAKRKVRPVAGGAAGRVSAL